MISVIIPVYNGEKYLEECLDSILNQTYTNLEIIIVNDGSTDNSLKMCRKYQKKDKRIKIINTENYGVSHARNIGIKESKGEYLYFMDCDDLINKFCFEEFKKYLIKDDELYSFGWQFYYKNSKKVVDEINQIEKFENVDEKLLLDDDVSSYLWNKIYLKDILVKNDLFFDESIHYCEDKIFNMKYSNYINKVVFNHKVQYLYRMRKNSATGNYVIKKNLSIFPALEYIIKNSTNDKIKDYYIWLYILNFFKFKRKFKEYEFNKDIVALEWKLYFSNYLSIMKKIKMIILRYFNISKKKNNKRKDNIYFE